MEANTVLIKNSELRVEISSLGAELRSVKRQGVEYLWQGAGAVPHLRQPERGKI